MRHRRAKKGSRLSIQSAAAVILPIAVLFAYEAAAECSGDVCIGTIERVYPDPGTNRVFVGTSGTERSLQCTPLSDVYIVLAPNQLLYGELFKLLNTAAATGQLVRLQMNSGTDQCRLLSAIYPYSGCVTNNDCPAAKRFCVIDECKQCRSQADCSGTSICSDGVCRTISGDVIPPTAPGGASPP